ncbi:hypothetical protein D9M69_550140 [compost metagenome]
MFDATGCIPHPSPLPEGEGASSCRCALAQPVGAISIAKGRKAAPGRARRVQGKYHPAIWPFARSYALCEDGSGVELEFVTCRCFLISATCFALVSLAATCLHYLSRNWFVVTSCEW